MQTNVTVPNFAKMVSQLNALNKDVDKAIQRTINDCKSRAPAQVTKAVTAVYGIKSSDVTQAGKAAKGGAKTVDSIKVSGVTLESVQLTYKGRVLTPSHFSMTPKKRPEGGQEVHSQSSNKEGTEESPRQRSVPRPVRSGRHDRDPVQKNDREAPPHRSAPHSQHPADDHERDRQRGHPEADRRAAHHPAPAQHGADRSKQVRRKPRRRQRRASIHPGKLSEERTSRQDRHQVTARRKCAGKLFSVGSSGDFISCGAREPKSRVAAGNIF